jgi:hypothetical protein
MTSHLILTEGVYDSVLRIYHGEDLVIALPRFVDPTTVDPDDPTSGEPFNLTGVDFELTIRPSFDHTTRFQLLTSNPATGIYKESAAQGLAYIKLLQATVEANIPLSPPDGWRQFMTLSWTDTDISPTPLTKMFARGPCYVYPGRDAATP